MPATITRSAAPVANSSAASWPIACRARPLGHADQDHSAADGHHVAALDRRGAPGLLRVAPQPLLDGREVRVEAVDRLHQQRLVAPCAEVQRVERVPVADPAGRVPRVEHVRQRRHQVVARPPVGAGRVEVGGPGSPRQVLDAHAADEQLRQPEAAATRGAPGSARRRAGRPRSRRPCGRAASRGPPGRRGSARARRAARAPPRPGRERVDEGTVIALRLLDPEHVVEEQVLAVARRERSWASPGAQTSTRRSRPTSEWAP